MLHGQNVGTVVGASATMSARETGQSADNATVTTRPAGTYKLPSPYLRRRVYNGGTQEAAITHEIRTSAKVRPETQIGTPNQFLVFDGGVTTGAGPYTSGRVAKQTIHRERYFLLWFVRRAGSGLSADVSDWGRAVRAVAGDSGVTLQFAGAELPVWSDGPGAALDVSAPCVRYLRGSASGALTLVYQASGGGIERKQTTDEGVTWSVATTITSAGTYPTIAITPTGAEHHFWRTDAGAIQTRVLSAQGTEMIAATTVVSSGAADDTLSAFERDGFIFLLYRLSSGGVQTVKSADGVTFT